MLVEDSSEWEHNEVEWDGENEEVGEAELESDDESEQPSTEKFKFSSSNRKAGQPLTESGVNRRRKQQSFESLLLYHRNLSVKSLPLNHNVEEAVILTSDLSSSCKLLAGPALPRLAPRLS